MTKTKLRRLAADAWLRAPMSLIPRDIQTSTTIHCACGSDMLLAARDFHARRCKVTRDE